MTEAPKKVYKFETSPIADAIKTHTFQQLEALWMDNLGANMPFIRMGKDVRDLPRQENIPAIIIGAGPSIRKYKQLETLADSKFNGIVFACDKILKPCLSRRIVPDYVVSTDGAEMIAEFYKGTKRNSKTKALFNGTTVHPKTRRYCGYDIYWFTTYLDDPFEQKSITRMIHYMTKRSMLQSLGNVGGMAWHLAYFLGCNPIGLIGMDYGYPITTHLEKTIYYKSYLKLVKGDTDKVQQFFKKVTNPHTDADMLIDINWESYTKIFNDCMAKVTQQSPNTRTINCSPESALFGDNIKYKPLEKFLDEYRK